MVMSSTTIDLSMSGSGSTNTSGLAPTIRSATDFL